MSFAGTGLLSFAGVESLDAAIGVSFIAGGVALAGGFALDSALGFAAALLPESAENDPLPCISSSNESNSSSVISSSFLFCS